MAKLFVICGHGAGDPGACSGGYSEAERVRALASRMKALGGSEVQIGDTSRNWYADNGIGRGDCPAGVPVIELHMDSAVASARGGHAIIKAGFDPDSYDNALANFIGSMFPGRSKLIVGRNDLANPNRAAAVGVNYRLLECCFISNSEDLAKFNGNLDAVAKGILGAFGIGSGGGNEAPSEPSKPSKPSGGSNSTSGSGFGGTYRCTVDGLNVRSAPSLSGSVVAKYNKGDTVNLHDWYKIAEGWVWGRYTSYSGATRYVAVGRATGKPENDDYLIKVGGGSASSGKSVDELAKEVIAGKWGNGQDRVNRLTAAGYDADAVQKRVNQLL